MSVLSLALNHPPIQRVQGHEPDHSSPFGINFKNEWSYASMAGTGTTLIFYIYMMISMLQLF